MRIKRNIMGIGVMLALSFTGCNDGDTVDNRDDTDVSGMQCNDALIEAAQDIFERYPTWRAAKRGESLEGVQYKEAHTEKELEGNGVTLVTISGVTNVRDWEGNLNSPSLLFFEKDPSLNKDDWPLIGFGYHTEWEDSTGMGRCNRPSADCVGSNGFEKNFIIHEAGYHHHGFEPAQTSNLKSGRGTIDSAGCNLIDKDDVKTKAFRAKHGRAWTMHVFLHPETKAPIITTTDPWERDGGNGWEYSVAAGSFYEQGDCSCSGGFVEPLEVIEVSSFYALVDEDDLANINNYSSSVERDIRVFPNANAEHRITMLSWLNPLEQLGILPEENIIGINFVQAPADFITINNSTSLNQALARIRALEAGDQFSIRIRRNANVFSKNYLVF